MKRFWSKSLCRRIGCHKQWYDSVRAWEDRNFLFRLGWDVSVQTLKWFARWDGFVHEIPRWTLLGSRKNGCEIDVCISHHWKAGLPTQKKRKAKKNKEGKAWLTLSYGRRGMRWLHGFFVAPWSTTSQEKIIHLYECRGSFWQFSIGSWEWTWRGYLQLWFLTLLSVTCNYPRLMSFPRLFVHRRNLYSNRNWQAAKEIKA